MKARFLLLASLMIPTIVAASGAGPLSYPAAPKDDTAEDHFGHRIPDPYRPLEDPNSAATKAWVEAENRLTAGYLAQIPERARIRERLTTLWNYERFTPPSKEGPWYIYSKNDGLQNQSVIYKTKALEAPGEVLIDPNTLAADGTVALGSVHFTDDGRYMAYSLASSGSDWIEWKVRDVATGADLPDHLKWSKFSGAAWLKDGSGFFYGRYQAPKDGEALTGVNKFQKLYFHKLGTRQDQDAVVYERQDQPDWMFSADVTDDGRFLIVVQSEGTNPENRVYVRDLSKPDAGIVPFLDKFDAEYHVVGNDGERFYVQTTKDAPRRRVVAIDLTKPEPSAWRVVIPEAAGRDVLGSTKMINDRFVTQWMTDAHEVLKVYSVAGAFERDIPLPTVGAISAFEGKRKDAEGFYGFSSFAYPGTVYRFDFATGKSTVFRQPKVDFSPSTFETTQVFYPSKDGTKIPMFITARKGMKMDGQNPTLSLRVWRLRHVSDPGVLAGVDRVDGNRRHLRATEPARRRRVWQGMARRRPAREEAERLRRLHRRRRIPDRRANTRPRQSSRLPAAATAACWSALCIDAASRPVRRRDPGRRRDGHAALPQIHDRLGVDLRLRRPREAGLSSKRSRSTRRSTTSKPGARIRRRWSTTADHDDRVVPAHSFKFAATLQAAQAGDAPILIRIETKAGHGAGKPTSKIIDERADIFAFLSKALGMKWAAAGTN